MSIPISIYDFFANTLPGGLYLFTFAYLFTITNIFRVDFQSVANSSTTQIIALTFISYILGLILDPIAKVWYRIFSHKDASDRVLEKYKKACPHLAFKFKAHDWPLLRAYVRRVNDEYARELERMSVLRIMLRNISLSLAILAVIQVFLAVTNQYMPFYIATSVVLAMLSILAGRGSTKYGEWFYSGFYEAMIAYNTEPSDWIERNTKESKEIRKPNPIDARDKVKSK